MSEAVVYRRRSRWRHFMIQSAPLLLAQTILALTLVAWLIFYYRQLDTLPTGFDWLTVLNTSMPLVFAAVGQSVVVLTRGLDLSIGGRISLGVSLAATHMGANAGDMLLWTLLILLAGAAGGLLNGLLVAYARLQPILVTLATLSIYQGLAIKILPQPGGQIPQAYTNILANPNEPTALVFIALVLGLWFVFRRTPFGVAVYALGNDEEAARANGIRVRRTKVAAYMVSGVCAAAAGLFLGATTTAGDATGGDVYVLTSIAAVVLGGVSFLGGRGSAVGSICGAFALTLVVNVLFFAKIDPLYQSFYQGLFLIVAVMLGTLVGRLARARRCPPTSPPTAAASSTPSGRPCSCSPSARCSSAASPAATASRRSWSSPRSWASWPPARRSSCSSAASTCRCPGCSTARRSCWSPARSAATAGPSPPWRYRSASGSRSGSPTGSASPTSPCPRWS